MFICTFSSFFTQLPLAWHQFVQLLFTRVDASGLAVNRILLGILLLIDIFNERGLYAADIFWANDHNEGTFQCRFPLFESITRLPTLEGMFAVYLAMVLGILGVILGYKYRLSCLVYSFCYWYILAIEKSRWNNHSYLFGLLSLMSLCNDSNAKWSLDALGQQATNQKVPFWQYFVLRFQVFLVYFYAGVKKTVWDWLGGHSMVDLSKKWVWTPALWLVPNYWIDYFVIHIGGYVFDSSVGFLLLWRPTRPLAFFLCAVFNLINSTMFTIGMFPFVMLAVMPVFCDPDWPVWLGQKVNCYLRIRCNQHVELKPETELIQSESEEPKRDEQLLTAPSETNTSPSVRRRHLSTVEELPENPEPITLRPSRFQFRSKNLNKHFGSEFCSFQKSLKSEKSEEEHHSESLSWRNWLTLCLLLLYIAFQVVWPFCHFLLPGYNTWTKGMYGYSWDMMVNRWNTMHTRVTVKGETEDGHRVTYYLNPDAWASGGRWRHHADMVAQFAKCVETKLQSTHNLSKIELYIDVWTALNGRFTQRMYDPKRNILAANWSPWTRPDWVLPILGDSEQWRAKMERIDAQIEGAFNASMPLNGTYLVYIADFPGMSLENYIDTNMFSEDPVLIVLDGLVRVTFGDEREYSLTGTNHLMLERGSLATISVTGGTPAYYAILYPPMSNNPPNTTSPTIDSSRANIASTFQSVANELPRLPQRNSFVAGIKFLIIAVWSIGKWFFGACPCNGR